LFLSGDTMNSGTMNDILISMVLAWLDHHKARDRVVQPNRYQDSRAPTQADHNIEGTTVFTTSDFVDKHAGN